jgi:hypothetical protein
LYTTTTVLDEKAVMAMDTKVLEQRARYKVGDKVYGHL